MTASQSPQTASERKERIEAAVMLAKDGRPRSLQQRMADFTIAGVSIAVINEFQIEWAAGYGLRKKGEPECVDTDTPFQACSISKAVTAMAVLRLVEDGRLDLDADVNTFLRSWKIPANGLWQPEITIRQLLSHTAGVSVPWFPGYHPQQEIPTLLDILNGAQPSNTSEIRVNTIPGLRFRYSGGGFTILQQTLVDVMQQPFPALMRELVLNPLGMEHSTYEQPLPAQQAKMAAAGHRASGKPIAGDSYIYPEMAAAGLWTTPSDLARLAVELQCARAGKPWRLLSPQMMQKLLTPQSRGNSFGDIGLGVFVEGAGPGARFGHSGDNTGFTSLWVSLIEGGQGCVLMTNSDNGWALQEELLHCIAQVYAWPELSAKVKPENFDTQNMDISDLYTGEYELLSGMSLTVSKAGNRLFLEMSNQPLLELIRCSDTIYQLAGLDDTVTFVLNRRGQVQALVLQQGTGENVAIKM